MDRAARAFVRRRAQDRCEYCGLLQDDLPLVTFHVEHVIARQHGGDDDAENLALACHHCNLHKGPNLTGIDPDTGAIERLFHPRKERWSEHFELRDILVVGLTPTGRTTARLLQMSSPARLELRAELAAFKRRT